MVKDTRARARATPHGSTLPDEIVFWEILVRLPPKSVLRCRSVCRAWHHVTSARDFLLAHHGCQPSLSLFSGDDLYRMLGIQHHNILAFNHRATTNDEQIYAIAQLDKAFNIEASCDGLLILSNWDMIYSRPLFSICNPATRQHAPLGLPEDINILGMYSHNPTGEYRLLLQPWTCNTADMGPDHKSGCYVFALGSDQPRYIGRPEMALGLFSVPVRMRDCLHWCPKYCPSGKNQLVYESKVLVFDTVAESFRHMRAPISPANSYMFEIDGTLCIHSRGYSLETISIWVLQNYESKVWDIKYRIKLPVAEIRSEFQNSDDRWAFNVVSADGGVILLINIDGWVLHVDNDGKVVNRFNRHRRGLYMSRCLLKQSLIQHTFFPALKGYNVNASPFIRPIE